MKAKPNDHLIDNIRSAIQTSKERLAENKLQRKGLIVKIRQQKIEIRSRECLISTLQLAQFNGKSIPPDLVNLAQQDLKNHFKILDDLRQNLFVAETFYVIEIASCRALHKRLDQFNVPVYKNRG